MTGPTNATTSLSDKLSLVTHHHLLTRVPVKLDFEDWNYGSWEFFFDQLCFSYDVSKYIHGNPSETATSNPPPLTPEELKVDKIILSWIFSTLSSRTSALKTELRSIKLGDLSMEAYFQKIESLMTILATLDSPVNDENVVHYALEGLPEKYNQVCGYMHYKDTFPDLKTVCSLLITEEMRLKSKALALPVNSSSPMVLMADSVNDWRSSTMPQVKSWRPCFNFAKGTCRFGESCRYVHDANARVDASNNGSNRARGSNENNNTTNELLAKVLEQLRSCNITNKASNATAGQNIANPVAYHTSLPPTGLSYAAQFSPLGFQPITPAQYYSPGYMFPSAPYSGLAVPSAQQAPTHQTQQAQPTVAETKPVPPLGHVGPSTLSGQATILPHAFNTETLSDPNIGAWEYGLSIVKNLIFVRQFVRDNNCTIEFDAFDFSVKDFTTRRVLLRCDSTGDLYPVTSSSPTPHAYLISQHTWHQRLGHPGNEVLRCLVSSKFISCNKEKPHVLCHACQLGKHVRLPFFSSDTVISSCFDVIHSDVWTSPILSLSGFKYYSLIFPLPKSYRDAFSDSNWQNAMRDEYNALIKNKTWILVPRPPDTNTTRYMWLFRHKYLADGTLSRYKARLVANSSTQLEGVDVDETFTPQIIRSLHQEFAMTNLGPLNYFIGISVTRDPSGLFLSQNKYAIEVLERAHIFNCNPTRTPVDTESKLRIDGDPVSDPTLYRSLPGSLQYLTFTRPDISYAVQQIWLLILMRIRLVAPTTWRSTSGYCVFLGNNLLSLSSKRQPTLSRSSAKAEYRSVANDVAETCWLRNLLREFHTLISSVMLVYCDNISVVYLSCNLVQHQRTKHIEIDIHFVRDLVDVGQVRVLHVPSSYQFANM
ncbi:ribonuclease H-like domain-containing protein [Tanacetum coccineum]